MVKNPIRGKFYKIIDDYLGCGCAVCRARTGQLVEILDIGDCDLVYVNFTLINQMPDWLGLEYMEELPNG